MAKASPEKIAKILKLHAQGAPNWALAERFGLSSQGISSILKRHGLSGQLWDATDFGGGPT